MYACATRERDCLCVGSLLRWAWLLKYTVAPKTYQLIFCSVLVKYELISINKITCMSWKKHCIKVCKKCPTHLKYVLVPSQI